VLHKIVCGNPQSSSCDGRDRRDPLADCRVRRGPRANELVKLFPSLEYRDDVCGPSLMQKVLNKKTALVNQEQFWIEGLSLFI
jgi:hypothetical protein